MELTITEALQEIKTIGNRLLKKREAVAGYVGRDSRLRDPFEVQGGSEKYIKEERQSINDLGRRLVKIRLEIQKANLEKFLIVNGETRTVADWLTWRRELAPPTKMWLHQIYKGIQAARVQLQQKGGKISTQPPATVNVSESAPPEVILNLDEQALLREIENMETILGALDGRLSLFNATTIITI